MLRPNIKQIWNNEMIEITKCIETNLFEIIIRLRSIYWNMEISPMKNILHRYPSMKYHYISDMIAIPYHQLKFDSFILPKYNECKNLNDYSLKILK